VSPVLLTDKEERGGGGCGGGAKSYEGVKTWSSENHSILSGKEVYCTVMDICCFRYLLSHKNWGRVLKKYNGK
jgi:hypothetical protein